MQNDHFDYVFLLSFFCEKHIAPMLGHRRAVPSFRSMTICCQKMSKQIVLFSLIVRISMILRCVDGCNRISNRVWILIGGSTSLVGRHCRFLWFWGVLLALPMWCAVACVQLIRAFVSCRLYKPFARKPLLTVQRAQQVQMRPKWFVEWLHGRVIASAGGFVPRIGLVRCMNFRSLDLIFSVVQGGSWKFFLIILFEYVWIWFPESISAGRCETKQLYVARLDFCMTQQFWFLLMQKIDFLVNVKNRFFCLKRPFPSTLANFSRLAGGRSLRASVLSHDSWSGYTEE